MPKYLVALAVGGLMECPEITYQDCQEIEAATPEEARKIYNEKNKCDFFYGEVLREIKEPETTSSDKFLDHYDEILTGESLAEEDLITQAFHGLLLYWDIQIAIRTMIYATILTISINILK